MAIQSTTGNYFRSAAHAGVRQRITRRHLLDLPGGIQLWQAVGKVLMWSIPVVLSLNLAFASLENSYLTKIAAERQHISEQKKQLTLLQEKKDRLISPVRVKLAAAEKLDLYEPSADQIRQM